jgi:hypothetical protein
MGYASPFVPKDTSAVVQVYAQIRGDDGRAVRHITRTNFGRAARRTVLRVELRMHALSPQAAAGSRSANGHARSMTSHSALAGASATRRQQQVPFLYSRISPGWHSSALQIASRVDSRIAFALPFFKTEILAIVMPTFSESSVTLIFRFANMTSMLMMIAMLVSLHR